MHPAQGFRPRLCAGTLVLDSILENRVTGVKRLNDFVMTLHGYRDDPRGVAWIHMGKNPFDFTHKGRL